MIALVEASYIYGGLVGKESELLRYIVVLANSVQIVSLTMLSSSCEANGYFIRCNIYRYLSLKITFYMLFITFLNLSNWLKWHSVHQLNQIGDL